MLRRAAVGATVILLILSAVATLPIGAATHAQTGEVQPPLTTPDGFNNTAFEIRVFENQSAKWTVRHTRPLRNETEIDRFRSFASTFESSETETFQAFRERASRLTAYGTNVTDRQMNDTAFSREARVTELGQTRGVVELSFVWTNFARQDGDTVVVDDVFEGGMYVDTGQRLVIARGPELAFSSVSPTPDSQTVQANLTASETVTWFGQRQFATNRPRAVLLPPEQVSAVPDGSPTAGAQDPPADDGSQEEGGIGMVPLAVAIVLLLGIGGGLAWYTGAFPQTGPQSRGGQADTIAGDRADRSEPDPSVDATAGVPEEELLSDEDRVLQLLDENGGRMKQVNIVEETEWSKSKVSMLLSDMEEEGSISKLRVGRENIISKAGEEPDAVGSPFDDE